MGGNGNAHAEFAWARFWGTVAVNFHCGIRELHWLYKMFPFVDLQMLNMWLPRYDPDEKPEKKKSLDELKFEMMQKGFGRR